MKKIYCRPGGDRPFRQPGQDLQGWQTLIFKKRLVELKPLALNELFAGRGGTSASAAAAQELTIHLEPPAQTIYAQADEER